MRKYEIVTMERRMESAIVCDACGKEHIRDDDHTDDWYTFSSRHQEWDNDSYESTETLDVCSTECYWKGVGDMLEEFEEYRESATIDDKSYSFMKGLYDERSRQ